MSYRNYNNSNDNTDFELTTQQHPFMAKTKKPFQKIPSRQDDYYDESTFHIFLCSKYEDGDIDQWMKCFESFMNFLKSPKFQNFGRKINIYHVSSPRNTLIDLFFQLYPYESFPENVEFNPLHIENEDDFYNLENGEMNILNDLLELKKTPNNLCMVISFYNSKDPCDAFEYMVNIRNFCIQNKIRFYQRLATQTFNGGDLDGATLPGFYNSSKRPFHNPAAKRPHPGYAAEHPPHYSQSLASPSYHDYHPPPNNRFRFASDSYHSEAHRSPEHQQSRQLPPELLQKLSDEDLRTLGYSSLVKKRQTIPESSVKTTYHEDGSLFQIITTLTFPH